MPHVLVLPSDSELTAPSGSTSKQFPSFEEYKTILNENPPPLECDLLFCIGYQSKGTTPSRADITANKVVEKPFETEEEWHASVANHTSNSTELSPFISATTDMKLAMKWIIQKGGWQNMQLYVVQPTKLKPGSIIKMDWALDALGGSPGDEHNTKVLIWQTIPATAVLNHFSLQRLAKIGLLADWMILELFGLGPETKPGQCTVEDQYEIDYYRYNQSKTELGFKDWWIAGLPVFDSAGSEPSIHQIIEGFRHKER